MADKLIRKSYAKESGQFYIQGVGKFQNSGTESTGNCVVFHGNNMMVCGEELGIEFYIQRFAKRASTRVGL